MYAGSLDEKVVCFPVGEFHLYAEIHEEAGAYAKSDIDIKFSTTLPDEDDYKAVDVKEMLRQASEVGDQARISQILQADVSTTKIYHVQ